MFVVVSVVVVVAANGAAAGTAAAVEADGSLTAFVEAKSILEDGDGIRVGGNGVSNPARKQDGG